MDDLAELLRTLCALFGRKVKDAGSVIALLKCSSGRFGSCLEAIMGEAMVELAAAQLGLRVVKIELKVWGEHPIAERLSSSMVTL